ncbi:MAG: iron-siderophore ABC transporter substrate-binding protein [Paenibacillaceae bacterium]|nr:iron-siderophore ABC transporter substrate-binding protein [Paenibacillaceae bacterium]
MSRFTKSVTIVLSLALLFLLAACGAKDDNKSAASPSPSSSASVKPSASASAAPSASPSASVAPANQSIKHALGTAEIKGTPKRIVALEWVYAEDLLALGIQPAGVADIAGYKAYVNVQPALAADVKDVGTRQEPNLEAIAALKPDLILAPDFRIKAQYEALNKIAPTIAFSPYPAEGQGDQYAEMETTFKTIANLTGKKAEADKVLADMNKAFEDAKAKLKAKNKENAEIVVAQGYTQQNAAVMRLYTDNSMLIQILQRAGLKNVYKADKFEVYGFSTTNVEALPKVQTANFIHITQANDNIYENQLKDNAVWKGLAFVKENRIYALPGNTWTFGGPLSAKVLADQAVTALTK